MNPGPKYVTRSAALAGVRRAVRERGAAHREPDYRYFKPNGWPLSLVGHVFCYQGITERDLELTAGPGANEFPILELCGVTRPMVYTAFFVQPDAVSVLEDTQYAQDQDLSWGDILKELQTAHLEMEY